MKSLQDRLIAYKNTLSMDDPVEREIRLRLGSQIEAAIFGKKVHVPTLRGNLRRQGKALPAPYGPAVAAIAEK